MKHYSTVVLAFAISSWLGEASADVGHRLGPPLCREVACPGIAFVQCPDYDPWMAYCVAGRQWWGPFESRGLIKVRIQALGGDSTTTPLFVEVRPTTGGTECLSAPGAVVWETMGVGGCHPDSVWVSSPPIDVTALIEWGFSYYLQLEGFTRYSGDYLIGVSPFVGAIELIELQTAVRRVTWSEVRQLYR